MKASFLQRTNRYRCCWSTLFVIVGCIFALSVNAQADNKDQTATTTTSASTVATHERISFINFSNEPIEIFWVDTNNGGDRLSTSKVAPYDAETQGTYSGHTFIYSWKGADTVVHIRQTSGVKDEPEGEPEADTGNIPAQVHVLGGMDQSETKKVICGSTKGDIRINVKPFWSPWGANRFLHLIHDLRYFDGCALNRVVPRFLTQFGIGASFDQRDRLRRDELAIPDDPHLDPPIRFRPGTMAYAGMGENTRSTEIFIVMPDSPKSTLEHFGTENSWETPFAYVEPDDLGVVGSWYSYGDMPPVSDIIFNTILL